MPHNQKTKIGVPTYESIPKLFLVALKDGQKVARICIDDMSNDKFHKTIKCQRLQRRTCEFELEESKFKKGGRDGKDSKDCSQ